MHRSLRLTQRNARASPGPPRAYADRHSSAPGKRTKVSWADDGDAGASATPGAATRARPGSPPPPPRAPSNTPPGTGQDQFRSWQKVAGEIQGALRDASLPQGTNWPCCQRFLTAAHRSRRGGGCEA